jgi:hypothetical protein
MLQKVSSETENNYHGKGRTFGCAFAVKATPHKARLTALCGVA